MSKEIRDAISLIFRDNEKVLVLKRSPNKESFPNAWSIPSIYILANETAKEAADRLVKRKLGLEKVYIQETPIGTSPVVDRGDTKLRMTDYEVVSFEGEINFNTEEYTEMKWVTPQKLLELIHKDNNGEMGECTKTFLASENLI